MLLFPAIDIKDGKVVRLLKGDFDTVHQVADDPVATANTFLSEPSIPAVSIVLRPFPPRFTQYKYLKSAKTQGLENPLQAMYTILTSQAALIAGIDLLSFHW